MSGLKTGAKGLEPSISGVTGQRDNQLRYAPVTSVTISKALIRVKGERCFFVFFRRKICVH